MTEATQLQRSVNAVRSLIAVRRVDSWKRKPEALKRISFFGIEDLWHYIPVWDEKLCDECLQHARNEYYPGTDLRRKFKYLQIVDENTIEARVHPHCRCFLTRVTDFIEYLRVTALIWGGLPWE